MHWIVSLVVSLQANCSTHEVQRQNISDRWKSFLCVVRNNDYCLRKMVCSRKLKLWRLFVLFSEFCARTVFDISNFHTTSFPSFIRISRRIISRTSICIGLAHRCVLILFEDLGAIQILLAYLLLQEVNISGDENLDENICLTAQNKKHVTYVNT